MPPKPKNTREEIAAAAFEIIKQEKISALTAKNVGKRLNSSASSIFTVKVWATFRMCAGS